jgi:hypothetical protein
MPAPPPCPRPAHTWILVATAACAALTFALLSPRWLERFGDRLSFEARGAHRSWGPVHDTELGLRAMTICTAGEGCTRIDRDDLADGWVAAVAARARGERVSTWSLAEDKAYLHELAEIAAIFDEDAVVALPQMLQRVTAWTVAATITAYALVAAIAALGVTVLLAASRRRPRLPISPASIAVVMLGVALVAGCVAIASAPGPAGHFGPGPAFAALGVGVVTGLLAAIKLARDVLPMDAWDAWDADTTTDADAYGCAASHARHSAASSFVDGSSIAAHAAVTIARAPSVRMPSSTRARPTQNRA